MATPVSRTSRKSNMMERLRRLQLRGPATAKPTATALPGRVIVTNQRAADAAKAGKAPTASKGQARHHEGALDLEILNSKLQQYAQTCSREENDDSRETEEEGSMKEPCRTQRMTIKNIQDSEVESQTKDKAVRGGADSAFERVSGGTSRHSSKTRASTCPSIVIHPPDDEQLPVTEPSDFDLFLQKAEDDERTRKEKGLPVLAKSKQESSVNPFYSNNPANPSSVPPKLAEIRESGDEESLTESDHSSSQRTASSGASSGSHDFAATETQATRGHTASLGRHVSFCEPPKLRARSESHGSAYHARGFESPKAFRSVTKRKSFRKMVQDCIRHL
ncbi:hypothetical protein N0V93_007700 [Gnomoniopsis smithogilvyi]|uniref:Uncharacterized protein n=1 Tax=Gnomoniopsis smithogilvyi TaxID=1191159 RepID=A0A9W8YKM2_9PEZI|nr:hypothetical protein N0V93_007700 [Gnomoniopsis smithogilvyi]